MLAVGVMLAALSVLSYRSYNAGMLDLGAMSQAIMSVLRGQPLVTTGATGNFSRLAGHVELIYVALAPLTALWRDPQPLLVAQAALMAAGAIPAYRLALRHLEDVTAARCVALIYLLYPVAQTAVLFDLHGDTLAMPLLMFALDAADREAWRPFALWAGLALLSKVYMAVPVVGIGAYLFLWGGRRRAGLIIGAAAVAYGAVVFFVVRELFAPTFLNQSAAIVYTNFYFGASEQLLTTVPGRLLSALVVVGPVLFVAWRGWRWLLVGAPLAAAALLSTGPGSGYHYEGHHYAALVPFIVMATVDGAGRLRATPARGRAPRPWRNDLIFTTMVVALCCVLLVDQPFGLRFWQKAPGDGLDPSGYGLTARDALKDRFLAAYVPPDVPIAASMFLASHLADRDTLYVTRYPDDPGGKRLSALLPEVDYALADALFDWRLVDGGTVLGGADYERAEIGVLLRDPAFGLTAARDGLLLFERGAPESAQLRQEVTTTRAQPGMAEALVAVFGPIGLYHGEVTHLGGRRYEASFTWLATGEPPTGDLIAVSSLDGVEGSRIVHLPTFALLPTSAWQAGDLINERFTVELPANLPPGRYDWRVAWYDPTSSEAFATDAASRIPDSAPFTVTTIEVSP
jgi:uncharacterized membrane protein